MCVCVCVCACVYTYIYIYIYIYFSARTQPSSALWLPLRHCHCSTVCNVHSRTNAVQMQQKDSHHLFGETEISERLTCVRRVEPDTNFVHVYSRGVQIPDTSLSGIHYTVAGAGSEDTFIPFISK
jgi:hypothetical protein